MKKSRSKMKNSMSRETTKDEARKEFLNAVKDIADCWVHSEGTTVDEKCNGVAFSILVLLDGCNVNVPVFSVIPVPHSSDKEYSIQKGENYYADVSDEIYKMGIGAGVELHDEFCHMRDNNKGDKCEKDN